MIGSGLEQKKKNLLLVPPWWEALVRVMMVVVLVGRCEVRLIDDELIMSSWMGGQTNRRTKPQKIHGETMMKNE